MWKMLLNVRPLENAWL